MRWSDIAFAPSSRILRQFAGLWLVVFMGLACWHGLWRQRPELGLGLAGLAAVVGLPGLLKPQSIRRVFVAAQLLALPIGLVVSHLILALLFYGVFTPLAVLFRLRGRDMLRIQRPLEQATYWTAKPAAAHVRDYFRPF
jgi:hypothetical protein